MKKNLVALGLAAVFAASSIATAFAEPLPPDAPPPPPGCVVGYGTEWPDGGPAEWGGYAMGDDGQQCGAAVRTGNEWHVFYEDTALPEECTVSSAGGGTCYRRFDDGTEIELRDHVTPGGDIIDFFWIKSPDMTAGVEWVPGVEQESDNDFVSPPMPPTVYRTFLPFVNAVTPTNTWNGQVLNKDGTVPYGVFRLAEVLPESTVFVCWIESGKQCPSAWIAEDGTVHIEGNWNAEGYVPIAGEGDTNDEWYVWPIIVHAEPYETIELGTLFIEE